MWKNYSDMKVFAYIILQILGKTTFKEDIQALLSRQLELIQWMVNALMIFKVVLINIFYQNKMTM